MGGGHLSPLSFLKLREAHNIGAHNVYILSWRPRRNQNQRLTSKNLAENIQSPPTHSPGNVLPGITSLIASAFAYSTPSPARPLFSPSSVLPSSFLPLPAFAHVGEGKPLEPAQWQQGILTWLGPDATSRAAVILLGHGNLPPKERGRSAGWQAAAVAQGLWGITDEDIYRTYGSGEEWEFLRDEPNEPTGRIHSN